jgi:hypothetical protein
MRLLSVSRESMIGLDAAAELAAYYTTRPRFFGLFLTACNLRVNRLAALRCAIGATRRSVLMRAAVPFDAGLRISAQVLVDAPTGAKHAALLLPIAAELTEKGVSVAMVYHGRRSLEVIRSRFGGRDSSPFELVGLPDTAPRQFRHQLPSVTAYRRSLPWQGLFGHAMALCERDSDGCASMWKAVLRRSSVRMVVTTYPHTSWTNALLYAGRELGIQCVHVQQGLQQGYLAKMPNCTAAVVWSRIGSAYLEKDGFLGRPIIIARNPSTPKPEVTETLRKKRRSDLGLAKDDVCALVLGQVSTEHLDFGDGYHRTCELIGQGLSIAARSGRVVPFLRPHHRDLAGETDGVLRQYGLSKLLRSESASLQEDIAAADVVLGMDTTAMEEAYLMGRPAVQAVAEGVVHVYDFGLLGIPVVRSPEELARRLMNRGWIAERHEPPVLRSVAEEVCGLLES